MTLHHVVNARTPSIRIGIGIEESADESTPGDLKLGASSSLQSERALRDYLDVRYSESEKPYNNYPNVLTQYLAKRFLTGKPGGDLLDLGCGRGEFLHGYSRQGFRAVGVDRARPTLPRFSEKVIQADYEQFGLPFDSETFDVLFSKSVFEHIRDVSGLMRECHRVLRPGGRMISLVPDWKAQWRHFYDDWTHVRPFTLEGLTQCIQSHGFEVLQAERFRQLPLLWKWPALRHLADLTEHVPSAVVPLRFRGSTWIRFSKEWMLLVVADKPLRDGGKPSYK